MPNGVAGRVGQDRVDLEVLPAVIEVVLVPGRITGFSHGLVEADTVLKGSGLPFSRLGSAMK
ncbi:hypothetical protein BHE97_17425 [Aeromicrobium sp. PE09-221]|nr:hypothetical protein BHE97_17425 [Aeromicrobium sp. PE09-221]